MIWLALARIAGRLWSFAKSPAGRWLALMLAIVAGLILVHQRGVSVGVAKEKNAEAARLKAGAKAAARVNSEGAKITAQVATQLTETRTQIQWRTRVQLQEVVRYVPVESDRACVVGFGALRLHQHAFAGLPGVPEPSGGPVEAPSGVPFSDLIADDIAFAGTAYDWRAEALAWREWYGRWAALWRANVKAPKADPPP